MQMQWWDTKCCQMADYLLDKPSLPTKNDDNWAFPDMYEKLPFALIPIVPF